MTCDYPHILQHCPDPEERAPLAFRLGGIRSESLRLASPALQGALVALIARDTRELTLDRAQRLSHFPASPLVTISWFHNVDVGLVERKNGGASWRSFGASVLIAGSQSQPTVSWTPTTGRGYMACFAADAAKILFGVDLAAIQDRFIPVDKILGKEWFPLWKDLLDSDDADVPNVLEKHLAKRWQALQGHVTAQPSLRQFGRHWVEKLAWQAHEWRRVQSLRQVERRVRSFSGRSLREWQSLVRTEGLFFAIRDCVENDQPLSWVALAQDQGYSDQAHMTRMSKRITGFSPGEFAQRFMNDESFWIYRLWV